MKQVVILGAGTAGTIMAVRLRRKLSARQWSIVVVDDQPVHFYQPGFLFLPFGYYSDQDVQRPRGRSLPRGVTWVQAAVDVVAPEQNRVRLQNGDTLAYDLLVIATGARIAPEETPGLLEAGWRKQIFDFYTYEGARALRQALARWQGGDLVMHITEMPIKCPVAPIEFVFLADHWLRRRGLRDRTRLTYVTPLSSAFTRPNCSKVLNYLLERKGVNMLADFAVERIEPSARRLVGFDGREIPYDLLVTVPTNKGAEAMARSGLGNELDFVPTDKQTLQAKAHENIFVLGDATDVPTSKAGSVAHFQAEVATDNILRYLSGQAVRPDFDGHTNCFIETGNGKAVLIDFNYEIEPVVGHFPLPVVGPLRLLRETRRNHWGKLAFRWIYWNLLLRARPLPLVTARMQTWGKDLSTIGRQAA